ncbi:hypothetical protein AAFF_G00209600 [Aldrovandia affinis]|uniref:Uncharacterized protein n=1 Tax=Aldrovandia affinis TaxID=143900 RepID=A0AAD7WVL9_9TELE|nr:hypothetical protein AAFF_G00209600 [Aldrovandia affinis]
MAMIRSTVLSFVAILTTCVLSTATGTWGHTATEVGQLPVQGKENNRTKPYSSTPTGNATVPTAECADFNATTWREYRQGEKLQVHYLLLTRSNMDCAAIFTEESLSDPQQSSHSTPPCPPKSSSTDTGLWAVSHPG